jgi:S-adenosyl-L-methionine hydrolase (adenosine-forming)
MSPLIALLTDFGRQDAYAGVLHGVIAGIAPEARVIDLTHDVPPQDVRAGAFLLLTAYRYFPPETIFVVVVDPGVGTARAILAIRAGGHIFVGPDNGVLRWAVEDAAGRAAGPVKSVRVEEPAFRLPEVSHTFHGRDVIAPAAAHLARGVPLGALGPPAGPLVGAPFPRPVEVAGGLAGEVLYVDRFGNAITNLPPGPGIVRVAGQAVPRRGAYAEGTPGRPLALAGSAGLIEVAVPGGSAAATLGIGAGTPVRLEAEG